LSDREQYTAPAATILQSHPGTRSPANRAFPHLSVSPEHRIQSRTIPAARQNTNPMSMHNCVLLHEFVFAVVSLKNLSHVSSASSYTLFAISRLIRVWQTVTPI
jgi:hypothetical protein